jgi:hypothetical protein
MRALRATQSPDMLEHSGVLDMDAFVRYMASHANLAPPAPRIDRLN